MKIGERTDANGDIYEVFSDGSTRLIAYRDDEGNMHYRDETWLEDVEVIGERPKWWQQYDPQKAEQARQNWNKWMPQGSKDYGNNNLFRQLGNTSSKSTIPKALQTKALAGNEFWQKKVFQTNPYDGSDYNRDVRIRQQFDENEQKKENERLKRLSTFLVSNPQYKYYTPSTGKIVKTIPYRGERHLHLSEKARTELRKGMLEQLSHYDLDDTYQTSPKNISDFFNDNFNRTEIEIITQRKDASKTFLGSQ